MIPPYFEIEICIKCHLLRTLSTRRFNLYFQLFILLPHHIQNELFLAFKMAQTSIKCSTLH